MNASIAKFDGQNGVTYLDIGDQFLEPDGSITRDMMGDYLHPTAKGYQVWADAMVPVLKNLIESQK